MLLKEAIVSTYNVMLFHLRCDVAEALPTSALSQSLKKDDDEPKH